MIPTLLLLAGVLCLAPSFAGVGDDARPEPVERPIAVPTVAPGQVGGAPAAGHALRIGGGAEDRVTAGGSAFFRFDDMVIDTSLPEGYPAPTPPDRVEVKTYPVVRRAEVSGRSNPDLGMNFGFFRLFDHIQRREIAMTSPVEMDYVVDDEKTEGAASNELEWTMSFLYRTRDLGPTGESGENGVEDRLRVVDQPPLTVISIGIRGEPRARSVLTTIEELEAWLARMPGWEAAGPPRGLYYNGPNVPSSRRWVEAQLPIRRVATEPTDETPAEETRGVFLNEAPEAGAR